MAALFSGAPNAQEITFRFNADGEPLTYRRVSAGELGATITTNKTTETTKSSSSSPCGILLAPCNLVLGMASVILTPCKLACGAGKFPYEEWDERVSCMAFPPVGPPCCVLHPAMMSLPTCSLPCIPKCCQYNCSLPMCSLPCIKTVGCDCFCCHMTCPMFPVCVPACLLCHPEAFLPTSTITKDMDKSRVAKMANDASEIEGSTF
mmetsp:Transcript_70510/g.121034  ORF Transcript_70510/g.121034 Transcript_70510/m.121034 type:complete len:206 (+) Transcript_70510:53-670(+)|eukprot:CAMPEP_0171941368 /NCGR_PEP_ID=MMETSP0993-20121228/37810_1 /TAXON_ID=483369 /ORGANISM="non described non described, Strain CCMP2098" /LENGTH=205 /DNA_ID=CAMNT_0012583591 /DNA_START=69 /DNA_END=686 /DNA_ORIENTATION=+